MVSTENLLFGFTTAITCVGMIGIGATTDYRIVLKYMKKPTAYLTGVLTQLFLMPLLAWAVTEMVQLDKWRQLVVMIQGCSPGGNISNIVVYWMGGITDLSVAMTCTTTILGLGMMPLWLFIFSKVTSPDTGLLVPFGNLGITLGSLVPPILIGMLVNAKCSKRTTTIVSKACILFGSVGIVVITIVSTVVRKIPWDISWKMILVVVLLPLFGFILGYLITKFPFLGLSRRVSRTVATEVALQNAQVAASVVQGSFSTNLAVLAVMVSFPLMYYLAQCAYSVVFVLLYKLLKRQGYFADEDDEINAERENNSDVIENKYVENNDEMHGKKLPNVNYAFEPDEHQKTKV